MSQQPSYPTAINGIVRLHGDTPTTTSLIIAEKFGKRHQDVMRAVRRILAHPGYSECNGCNFALVTYHDGKGEQRPYYEITRDGFTLLAMSFTGHAAMAFKLRFIDAFNRLEREVLERVPQLEAECDALRQALLSREPRWSAMARYHQMGLMQIEIAKLMGVSRDTVRRERYAMEALGLLPTSQQLSLLAGGDS